MEESFDMTIVTFEPRWSWVTRPPKRLQFRWMFRTLSVKRYKNCYPVNCDGNLTEEELERG